MDTPRYKAFISYSHRDQSWARWLQRSLESYRVPKRIVGEDGAYGPVPARLRPVFRDREDLSSAYDLTSQIKGELENSDALIVICSPAAVASRWVNEEIRQFRRLGRGDRILALVVDGDPQAQDGSESCFPTALLETSDGASREPLAADVRRYADGKHLSRLKIIAGLLGIRLDDLRRRDAQRRLRRRSLYGFAAILLVSLISWLVYSQTTTQAAAQAQRASTEDLLGFMLGDLDRLDPIAGLESFVLEDEGQLHYAAQLGFDDMHNDTLLEKAIAWRESGLDLKWQGDIAGASEQFDNSRAAIIELHQREGNTTRAVFELGQAEYYVGEIHAVNGELDEALQHWSHYGALSRRLLNAEPNNPKYVMELSYTLNNLGALEQSRPVPDVSKALQLMQAAVQYNQMALVFDPENPEYRQSLATELAWMADAWMAKCALGNALEVRQETVSLRREMVEWSPEDAYHKRELAYTLSGLAGVQQKIGMNEQAIGSFVEAVEILKSLHQAEPENSDLEWQMLYREARLARLLIALGELEKASQIIFPMAPRISELNRNPANTDHFRTVEAAFFKLDQARLFLARGETEYGEELLRSVTEQFVELVGLKPEVRDNKHGLAAASFEYWQQFGTRPDSTVAGIMGDYLSSSSPIENCTDASLAARVAVSDGNSELAEHYVDYVVGKGYFEPAFVNFCQRYDLCDLR